jgi:hypothetical protein
LRFEVTVSIITVNTSVTQVGVTLTAVANGAGYQWMNCATNTIINGAVAQSYTPTQNGVYAVIVTQNNCSDTSLCISVLTVGLAEEIAANGIKVFPNPATDVVSIIVGRELVGTVYSVIDNLGRIVRSEIFSSESSSLIISDLPAGAYTIRYGVKKPKNLTIVKY